MPLWLAQVQVAWLAARMCSARQKRRKLPLLKKWRRETLMSAVWLSITSLPAPPVRRAWCLCTDWEDHSLHGL